MSRPIPWMSDPRLQLLGGRTGNRRRFLGPDHPDTLAAETEVRALRAELAVGDLLNSPSTPTPEQLDRLRWLLDGAA